MCQAAHAYVTHMKWQELESQVVTLAQLLLLKNSTSRKKTKTDVIRDTQKWLFLVLKFLHEAGKVFLQQI